MNFLVGLGIWGLLLGVLIEAVSLPFPAALFILIYGYILQPSPLEIILYSLAVSVFYVMVSFIPYWLSIKYETDIRRKLSKKKQQKFDRWTEKYGDWTITLGRILGMGYIAYLGGFCSIKPARYGMLTFLGVLPVSITMFYLGSIGNLAALKEGFNNVQWVINGLLLTTTVSYVLFKLLKRKPALAKVKQKDNR
ncbi:VTT domain-containing protein [Rossellomorea vietnamensis]|uniref:VTT domain-containing protein n=1 Tax=Rossellomorea vietnamensis TaxID=218284 RepID=A0A5D4MKP2_9BACI|nr:VTT domain-containing protein [Bacillus sp. P14.5]TYS01566.1 VTT domain-containing protein [Rossellomorea vietnamensis]